MKPLDIILVVIVVCILLTSICGCCKVCQNKAKYQKTKKLPVEETSDLSVEQHAPTGDISVPATPIKAMMKMK